MNYSETVEYLYTKLPMFSRKGARALKPDLKNTIALCKHLGHPEKTFKTIHIAGTNGKGSVSHMLAAVLQKNGYKTGLFTSPHLHDFRERMKVNGQMAPESFVVEFVKSNAQYSERIGPSFFELTFAMAMDYFAKEKVDIAVIETGLGGRLDSTNVITPILSVITNIGYDHMDILGDTLEKIAGEKAGIIKPEVPVVIGETHPETKEVFIRTAAEQKSPIIFADQSFEIIDATTENNLLTLQVRDKTSRVIKKVSTDLTGSYQKNNLITVLSALQILSEKLSLSEQRNSEALASVRQLTGFEGRWQILQQNPLLVMDVGHNADGIRKVIQQLAGMKYRQLHFITGMVKDKDRHAVLKQLPKEAVYYFTNAHIPRALSAKDLQKDAASFGLAGNSYDDVNEAITQALKNAEKEDLILVCGSVFVVGEVDVDRFKS